MSMALRVEYPGAIHHVMCRGNARRRIFHDEADHQRLIDGLALTVSRFGWEMSRTLAELAPMFGLGHADSVRNLTRRVDRALPYSGKLRQDIAAIRQQLPGTERI